MNENQFPNIIFIMSTLVPRKFYPTTALGFGRGWEIKRQPTESGSEQWREAKGGEAERKVRERVQQK